MLKLVLLTLCLLVAMTYAVPTFEDDAISLPLSTPVEGTSIPLDAARACTNSWCLSLCRALGWPNGICLDRNTCFCWRR